MRKIVLVWSAIVGAMLGAGCATEPSKSETGVTAIPAPGTKTSSAQTAAAARVRLSFVPITSLWRGGVPPSVVICEKDPCDTIEVIVTEEKPDGSGKCFVDIDTEILVLHKKSDVKLAWKLAPTSAFAYQFVHDVSDPTNEKFGIDVKSDVHPSTRASKNHFDKHGPDGGPTMYMVRDRNAKTAPHNYDINVERVSPKKACEPKDPIIINT